MIKAVLFALVLFAVGIQAAQPENYGLDVRDYYSRPYLAYQTLRAPQDTKTDVLHFVEGFLNGIDSAASFDQLKACITDTDAIKTNVEAGIADIKTKDAAKVKQGIALLGQAAKSIPTAAQVCKASAAQVEHLVKLVETFTNPTEFLYFVGKNILINRVEVFNEVSSAIKAYETQDFTSLGYWIGKAMDTIFLGSKFSVRDNRADVLAFVEGFLNGVGSASVFDSIKECITDVDTIASEVISGVEDIKTKQPAQVKAGIALIGQAVEAIPAAAQLCKAADADVETLLKMVESFKSPESFLYYVGKSLLINHVEVLKEVSAAIDGYESHNFTTVGYWVGKAMDTIFLGTGSSKAKDSKTDILHFVEGFLNGVGSASAFDQLRGCITDVDTAATDLATGIKDIETKDPAQVKAGVALIGQAVDIIPKAAQVCQASEADIANLVKLAKTFQSPEAFLYYVGKSLLINHVEVIHEVISAVDAYEDKDYTTLGYWVGKAMDTIILGQDSHLNQDFANYLNKVSGWKAAVPSKFEGMTLGEIKQRFLGANLVDFTQYENLTVFDYEGSVKDIPASFNSSEQWPGCVHDIRDQGQCGSCWAFAASESLSDRFCIASNGSVNVVLSPQYLLSCNNVLDHGCNGGTPLFSWWFIVSDGLVTDACLPYASGNGTNPIKCKDFTACNDGSDIKYYKAQKGSVVQLPNPTSIQTNVLQYGPVEAGMTVYQDFMYYSGGVYTHTSGSALGGHAVKIIGWGNDNGTNYWIVANSWGPSWGENGYFRIAFGQCGIDSGVVTGQADLTQLYQSRVPRYF